MDEISPMATRELDTTLEACSIQPFSKKSSAEHPRPKLTMPPTTARVIFTMCTRIFNNRLDELRGKMNASNEDKGVKKACKELAGQCKKLIKDAKNEIKKQERKSSRNTESRILPPDAHRTPLLTQPCTSRRRNRMLLTLTRTLRRRHPNMNLTQTLRVSSRLARKLVIALFSI